MGFENFLVDKNNNAITWQFNGELISVACQDLDNAYLFSKNNLILALVGKKNYPEMLIGFNEKGTRKFEVNAPEGFQFAYLTEHPTAGVAVVCGSDERVDGWMDWHFAVDPVTGELKRHCPAY